MPCHDADDVFDGGGVLVLEDSRTQARLLKTRIDEALGVPVDTAADLNEARAILDRLNRRIIVAVLDLHLPAAGTYEIVEFFAERKIPSIVFTSVMDKPLLDFIWSRGIVDYVLKDSMDSLDYVVRLIERLKRNRQTRILVVDDSPSIRRQVTRLLEIWNYRVTPAAGGREALALLERDASFSLMITDYHMPEMDGFELVAAVRAKHDRDTLPIIGISGREDESISARFLKLGAADYLNKPFNIEEFYCRVRQNVEMREHVLHIKELSEKDFLTKLYNRRYFYARAGQALTEARAAGRQMGVAILDIDHFKRINDTCGHDGGDAVLKHFADCLRADLPDDLLTARLGGEEFCVLCIGRPAAEFVALMESLRQRLKAAVIAWQGQTIRFTVSIGVCCAGHPTLSEMLQAADEQLYAAKQAGRDQVRSG